MKKKIRVFGKLKMCVPDFTTKLSDEFLFMGKAYGEQKNFEKRP